MFDLRKLFVRAAPTPELRSPRRAPDSADPAQVEDAEGLMLEYQHLIHETDFANTDGVTTTC